MKAEIKSHIIIDNLFILPELYTPNNINEFNIKFSFSIGPKNENSEEIFTVKISNSCFQENIVYSDNDIFFKKGCIEINRYDYKRIMNAVEKYINNINLHHWNEIVNELRKVFLWEFENYKPYVSNDLNT